MSKPQSFYFCSFLHKQSKSRSESHKKNKPVSNTVGESSTQAYERHSQFSCFCFNSRGNVLSEEGHCSGGGMSGRADVLVIKRRTRYGYFGKLLRRKLRPGQRWHQRLRRGRLCLNRISLNSLQSHTLFPALDSGRQWRWWRLAQATNAEPDNLGTLKPQTNGNAVIRTARRAWTGCGPVQSPSRCTKCNSPPINGQCTNFILFDVALWLPLHYKGLNRPCVVEWSVEMRDIPVSKTAVLQVRHSGPDTLFLPRRKYDLLLLISAISARILTYFLTKRQTIRTSHAWCIHQTSSLCKNYYLNHAI